MRSPFGTWRDQPIEKRRLQSMLGFGLATFTSMLLAIALRGGFVQLFLLMLGCLVVYVGVAAYIGSVELRHREAQNQVRRTAVRRAGAEPASSDPVVDEPLVDGRLFDDDFFDPIPELVFEPLNIEEPPAEQLDQGEVGFKTPTAPRRAPKARPIYVEPDVDEGGDAVKVVND